MTPANTNPTNLPDRQLQQLRDKHLAEAEAMLCGPGGHFELVEEDILGRRFEVFANRHKSLRDLLLSTEQFADREFLVLEDQRLSFAETVHRVNSVAQAFKQDFGIQPGDRVAILAANCPEWAISFFAAASIGAIVSAFNGWWTPAEIAYGLSHSQPRLLVGDSPRLARLKDLDSQVPTVNMDSDFASLQRHAPDAAAPGDAINEDDPCLILYTSGTTGQPKGALISHRGLIGFIQTTLCNGAIRSVAEMTLSKDLADSQAPVDSQAPAGSPSPTDNQTPTDSQAPADSQAPDPPPQPVILGTSPLFHVSGLHAGILLNLAIGGKIIYRRGRFDPEDVLRLIQEEKITSFSAIGSMGSRVVRHPSFGNYDVSSIRQIGSGGSPTSPALQQLLRESFPSAAHSMGTGYGSSESTAVIANIGGLEYLDRPESCGRPGIGMQVEIRDENNQPVPVGQEGEIHCRSAYTMLQYWDNPEATTATIKQGGWLATGDIGHLDEDGYLYVNSRARDMILRNAENIYPIEIEYRLDAHPDVEESAVLGVEHPDMGQEVKAVVVPLAGRDPEPETFQQQLAQWCAETLAPYKIPSIWEIRRDPLPRNAAGKLLKQQL